jgi:integrase
LIDSGVGLANATLQQRLVVVRLFYDHLIEEGRRDTNPVGRGRYTPGRGFGGHRDRGLIPRFTKLPWIPTDAEWQQILAVARGERLRTADARARVRRWLRREELQPAHGRSGPRVSHAPGARRDHEESPSPRATLLSTGRDSAATYLTHRRTLSSARGLLFLSESRRNRTQPITLWTWSKVIRALAVRTGLARFSTHTPRHLCLTDLARSGWELHEIARFAGHRTPRPRSSTSTSRS